MHIVYILKSVKLNRFYIGYTSNLDLRLEFHADDTQTRKFTHSATDWELVFTINCATKKQGLLIEQHIKSMKSKVYIHNLTQYPEMTEKLLEKYKEASDC